jgi:hypothetical protein
MQSFDKILDAFGRLIKLLVDLFGPRGAVLFLVGVVIALLILKWLAQRRAERGWRMALEEKERSIQRLAAVERTYRLEALVRDRGMTLQEAELLLMLGAGPTPPTSAAMTPNRKRWWRVW